MIYLDNAATTKMDARVLSKMMPWLSDSYGNAGALYSLGRNAKKAVENARCEVAQLINCDPEQVIFTSGGSESNNMAIKGTLEGRGGVLLSTIEHDSIWSATDSPDYYRGGLAALPDGRIVPSVVEGIWDECYDLVSVMYVNNEVGTINPVSEISAYCHDHNLLFHTDCVQALGSVEVDMKEIDCDFASFSSHKIHGPKGVGALYVKNKDILIPLISGGAVQEYGLRGGTENVAGIVGFGEACRIVREEGESHRTYIKALNEVFIRTLEDAMTQNGLGGTFHINSSTKYGIPKIVNVRFDYVGAQSLVLLLDAYDICVSAGSACHSHNDEPSRTLTAMGLTPDEARSSIRVSFSSYNTSQEVMLAARKIADCVRILRTMETTWGGT